MALVDLLEVDKQFESQIIFQGINFHIDEYERIVIVGRNGSGKSTLLNMIGALDKPTNGQIIINGQDLSKIRDKDKFRAHTVGFVFQFVNLIPTLTARENVEVPMMGHLNLLARRRRAKELLELVGLGDRMRHLPNQLSGGQRQRVAVARALANAPDVVLADEPTGSLDTESGRALMKLLHKLNQKQGTTFIVVTHDPAVARQTHRVIVLADGKIARQDIIGSPIEEDLKMWRHSGLGRRIMEGDPEGKLKELNLPQESLQAVRTLLEQAHA